MALAALAPVFSPLTDCAKAGPLRAPIAMTAAMAMPKTGFIFTPRCSSGAACRGARWEQHSADRIAARFLFADPSRHNNGIMLALRHSHAVAAPEGSDAGRKDPGHGEALLSGQLAWQTPPIQRRAGNSVWCVIVVATLARLSKAPGPHVASEE